MYFTVYYCLLLSSPLHTASHPALYRKIYLNISINSAFMSQYLFTTVPVVYYNLNPVPECTNATYLH